MHAKIEDECNGELRLSEEAIECIGKFSFVTNSSVMNALDSQIDPLCPLSYNKTGCVRDD